MPGPPPDMRALNRQRDWKQFTRLPRECSRPVPDWPVEIDPPSIAELAMWTRLWQTPQAHVWHADHNFDAVALYVRSYLEAAKPRASSIARTGVRTQANELLLGTAALHAAKYVIVDSDEDQVLQDVAQTAANGTTGAAGGAAASRPGPRRSSARSRMAVVPDTGPAPVPTGPEDEEPSDDPDA